MANQTFHARLTCLSIGIFGVHVVTGCGGGNLDGYRPAREHSARSASNRLNDPLVTDSEPGTSGNSISANSPSDAERVSNDSEFLPVSALVPVNMIDGANVRALMSIPASDAGSATSPKIAPTIAVEATSGVIASEPRKIELLVKEKTFRTDSKTGAIRLSFDDLDLLKVLNMDPVVDNAVELMPEWLKAINGKTVRLRGFMYPTFEAEGIEHFVLARDNQICCFGRDPKIYDLVQVDMKEGQSTNYIPPTRAFDVVGRFKMEMQSQEGKPFGLYVIEQAQVIDR